MPHSLSEEVINAEKRGRERYETIAAAAFEGASNIDAALERGRAAVLAELDMNIQAYSSIDWLFYLRSHEIRELCVWQNDGLETAHLAEHLTAKSRKDSGNFSFDDGRVASGLNESRSRKTAELIGGVFVLREIRVCQTLRALEIEFDQPERGKLPEPIMSEDQKKNVDAYMRRTTDQPMALVTGGGILLTSGELDEEDTTFPWIGYDAADRKFTLAPLGLAKFATLASESNVLNSDFSQAIGDVLLILKTGYVAARNAGVKSEVERRGMFCIRDDLLVTILTDNPYADALRRIVPQWQYLPAERLIENLKLAGLELGYAPAIRSVEHCSAVDLHSASTLLDFLVFKAWQKKADQRGSTFADDVQFLIDASPWRPNDEIKGWRGRLVKTGERTITDIDAIGERDGILLIVEAKAIYYSLLYGVADLREQRNARERCEQATRDCSEEQLLSATNFDFGHFSNLVRVVCTPVPIYCDEALTIPRANGFPRVASCFELSKLLNAQS